MNGMIAGLAQGQSVLINANKTSRPWWRQISNE